jgi:hypothetical protein
MNNVDLSLAQISNRTGLDAETNFRMGNTLVSLGYLERGEEAKRYHLGLKILDLGFNAIGHSDIRDIVRLNRPGITSALYSPLMVSARALSYESPTLPRDGSMPASARRSV